MDQLAEADEWMGRCKGGFLGGLKDQRMDDLVWVGRWMDDR